MIVVLGGLMLKYHVIILFIGAGAILTGCTRFEKLRSQSRADPVGVVAYGKEVSNAAQKCPSYVQYKYDNHLGAINLDCFRFPEDRDTVAIDSIAYVKATKTQVDRNRLVGILMTRSDQLCEAMLGRLTADQAITNTVLSTLTSGLAASATIVTGGLAQTALAGSATFTNAARDHVNAYTYRNTLSTALTQAINNARKPLREEIEKSIKENPDQASWPIDLAISQVNRYYQQCSFQNALSLVSQSVSITSGDYFKSGSPKSVFEARAAVDCARVKELENLKASDADINAAKNQCAFSKSWTSSTDKSTDPGQ